MGEKYHLDIQHKIKTNMNIDRAIFESYGKIGLGHENPLPDVSVSPFGTIFVPVMYGCKCCYTVNADPSARKICLHDDQVNALEPWTLESFTKADPVRLIVSQIEYLKKNYDSYRIAPPDYSPHVTKTGELTTPLPHFPKMSAQQNLGSAINNAFSLQGESLYIDYITNPNVVHNLYSNITNLMLLSMNYFQKLDGWPLTDVFVGNCSVAMISPDHYNEFNYPYDLKLMNYARSIGARFMMHQDSDVNRQLKNYRRFSYLHFLDLGQDTDFEIVAKLFPDVNVNCMLFPSWIQSHSIDDIKEELRRLMSLGKSFPSFSFSLLEVDQTLGKDKIFAFVELFEQCAEN